MTMALSLRAQSRILSSRRFPVALIEPRGLRANVGKVERMRHGLGTPIAYRQRVPCVRGRSRCGDSRPGRPVCREAWIRRGGNRRVGVLGLSVRCAAIHRRPSWADASRYYTRLYNRHIRGCNGVGYRKTGPVFPNSRNGPPAGMTSGVKVLRRGGALSTPIARRPTH